MTEVNNYNPFADYGNIVYGEQFVGRQEAIKTIQQRIITPPKPGCLAIVGAPRIGKSSLAYHVLIHPRDSLIKRQILTFRINLPDVKNHEELFRELVKQTLEALDDADSEDESLFIRGRGLLEKTLHWLDLQSEVRQFFKRVKRSQWRVVAVIDEFDEARHIFQDGVGFQALRELAYQPEWSVCWVTISRRSLSEITHQSRTDISNLPGIFRDEVIRCFSREELGDLLKKLKVIGINIENNFFEFVWNKTGGHPHLASAIAFEFANSFLSGNLCDLEKALEKSTSEFLKYYDNLVNILKEDGSLKNLLEILFGPVTTATRVDAEKFSKYGLITNTNNNGYYTAFSSHFEDYLRLIERSVDLWPLWSDTEKKLRAVIDEQMEKHYNTTDWICELEKAQINIKNKVFDKCRELQSREQKSFGNRASSSLLDFTNMDDLWEIIRLHWNLFGQILGKDKNYWTQRFQFLATVRNPMAHNRADKVLAQHERTVAEGYCREIIYLLDKSHSSET